MKHGQTAAGREVEAAVVRLTRRASDAFGSEADEERRRATALAFKRRLGRGDYGGLMDKGIRDGMAQAVAEKAVAEEIGALRLTPARLVGEVRTAADGVGLGQGVARVAGASVRAVVRQKELGGEDTSEFQAALFQALAELDAEEEARRAAEEGAVTGGTLREIGWEAWPLAVGLDEE